VVFFNRVVNSGRDIDNVAVAGSLFREFLGLKADHATRQL